MKVKKTTIQVDALQTILRRPAMYLGEPTVEKLDGFISGVALAPHIPQEDRVVLDLLPLYVRIRVFGYDRNASWAPALLSTTGTEQSAFDAISRYVEEIRYGISKYGISGFRKTIETNIEEFVKETIEVAIEKDRRSPNQAL